MCKVQIQRFFLFKTWMACVGFAINLTGCASSSQSSIHPVQVTDTAANDGGNAIPSNTQVLNALKKCLGNIYDGDFFTVIGIQKASDTQLIVDLAAPGNLRLKTKRGVLDPDNTCKAELIKYAGQSWKLRRLQTGFLGSIYECNVEVNDNTTDPGPQKTITQTWNEEQKGGFTEGQLLAAIRRAIAAYPGSNKLRSLPVSVKITDRQALGSNKVQCGIELFDSSGTGHQGSITAFDPGYGWELGSIEVDDWFRGIVTVTIPKENINNPPSSISSTAQANGNEPLSLVNAGGQIGPYKIVVTLSESQGAVQGSYRYANKTASLRLEGEKANDGVYTVREFDERGKQTGMFTFSRNGGSIRGIWVSPNNKSKYNFVLN